MAIVFAHSNLAQFRTLHGWLQSTGKAESYLLCSEANHRKWRGQVRNLVPFRPHEGTLKADGSFYYLTRVEGAQRRSLGIRRAVRLRPSNRVDLSSASVTRRCRICTSPCCSDWACLRNSSRKVDRRSNCHSEVLRENVTRPNVSGA